MHNSAIMSCEQPCWTPEGGFSSISIFNAIHDCLAKGMTCIQMRYCLFFFLVVMMSTILANSSTIQFVPW